MICASWHVKTPYPDSDVIVHLDGTWPQLRRQTTSGVGTPTAVQLMMIVVPMLMLIIGGGGMRIVGLAVVYDIISNDNITSSNDQVKSNSTYSIRFRHFDLDSRVPCRSGKSAECTDWATGTGIRRDGMEILSMKIPHTNVYVNLHRIKQNKENIFNLEGSVCNKVRPSYHRSRHHHRISSSWARTVCWRTDIRSVGNPKDLMVFDWAKDRYIKDWF